MSGVFIVFEGGDGAGKSTQVAALKDFLDERGVPFIQTFEPGATPLGAKIRQMLLHEKEAISPKTEALLYAADRAQHVSEVVNPALAAGITVVQDRYIDSSLAYQGAGRVLDTTDIAQINEWGSDGLKPDLTILLDIDPALAATRRDSRGGSPDRLEREKTEFHEAVRRGFLNLAEEAPERYLVLDAAKSAAALSASIRERVATLLA